jgi:hypothetical protein
VISASPVHSSSISRAYPRVCPAGANGCRSANSGQVIAAISTAAFSFIVQEPSGIIVRSSARSLSDSFRRYRSMAVSERCVEKTGWVRNGVRRRRSAGRASAPSSSTALSSAGTPNASATSRSVSTDVVSSQATATVSASTRRRLTRRCAAAATTSSARPGTDARTVSKNEPWTTSTPPARSQPARAPADRCTRAAMAVSPSGPW